MEADLGNSSGQTAGESRLNFSHTDPLAVPLGSPLGSPVVSEVAPAPTPHNQILLGLFLCLLSLVWLTTKLGRRNRAGQGKAGQQRQGSLATFLVSLPCCGICCLVLTGLAIIGTVSLGNSDGAEYRDGQGRAEWGLVTTYISFSLVGLVEILLFYTGQSMAVCALPRQADSLATCLAFLVEWVVVEAREEWGSLALTACLAASLLRLVAPSSTASLGLATLTLLQGTWTLHTALLPSLNPDTASLHFSWHLLAAFVTSIAITVALNLVSRRGESKPEPGPGLTCTRPGQPPGQGQPSKSETSDDCASLASLPTALQSLPSTTDSNAEVREGERVSPLEEFNTLHRHTEGVRKSIKLKESSIV